MSYGRTAPEGIPQAIWDRAIAEWLDDDSTVDSERIMRIAKRLMRETAPDRQQEANKFDAWWEHPHDY